MSDAIVPVTNGNAMTQEQVSLLKRTLCANATDDELSLFSQVCKRTGLDPFAGQIFAVKRFDSFKGCDVMSIQTGIAGLRVIAERSGRYAGQLGPYWTDGSACPACRGTGVYEASQCPRCLGDGLRWLDLWLSDTPPAAARVGIMRSDFKEPLWATAKWTAYAQAKKDGTLTHFWKKMGAEQLAKCAEALGMRRAFPNDMSGLYTQEEMGQADNPEDVKIAEPPKVFAPLPEVSGQATQAAPIAAVASVPPPSPVPSPSPQKPYGFQVSADLAARIKAAQSSLHAALGLRWAKVDGKYQPIWSGESRSSLPPADYWQQKFRQATGLERPSAIFDFENEGDVARFETAVAGFLKDMGASGEAAAQQFWGKDGGK